MLSRVLLNGYSLMYTAIILFYRLNLVFHKFRVEAFMLLKVTKINVTESKDELNI